MFPRVDALAFSTALTSGSDCHGTGRAEAKRGWNGRAKPITVTVKVVFVKQCPLHLIRQSSLAYHGVFVAYLKSTSNEMPLFINRDQIFAHQVHLLEHKLRVSELILHRLGLPAYHQCYTRQSRPRPNFPIIYYLTG